MLNSRLDIGSPLLGSFSDLEKVALFVCPFRCLLVFAFFQEVDVIMIDVVRFEGVPNCFVGDGIKCLTSSVAVHFMIPHSKHFCSINLCVARLSRIF